MKRYEASMDSNPPGPSAAVESGLKVAPSPCAPTLRTASWESRAHMH